MQTTPGKLSESQAAAPKSGRSWWEKPGLLAVVFSICVHLTLLVLLAPLIVGVAPAGGGDEGIASALPSLTKSDLTDLPETTLPVPSVNDDLANQPLPADLPAESDPGTRPEEAEGLALLASGLAQSGRTAGAERSIGLSAAGGASARFFGVEARGSRFAYVVDISGSMNQDRKLEALKEALLSSIDGLLEQTSFCLVVYSGDAYAVTGSGWMRADRGREEARRAILALSAAGATNPMPALDIVFGLTPRPDAVYFMTDGMFEKTVEDRLPSYVERLNRAEETPVTMHCITFVDRGSEGLMRRLARTSGGSYTHVDAPRR